MCILEKINAFLYLRSLNLLKGHSSLNGNWLKFLERLGVNSVRSFVSSAADLREFIGTVAWGKNLNDKQTKLSMNWQ